MSYITMEEQDLINTLPQELMQIIIHETSLQAVASIWMSNKYWHAKLRNIMEHPKILFVTRDHHFRTIFVLNNGIAQYIRIRKSSQGMSNLVLVATYRWLNSVKELQEFIAEFKQIIKDGDKIVEGSLKLTDKVDPANFFLKIKNKEPNASHSTIKPVIYEPTFDLLQRLVDECQSMPDPASQKIVEPYDTNRITIDIENQPTSMWSRIRINSDGEIHLTSKLKTALSFIRCRTVHGKRFCHEIHNTITVQMHASKAVFKQLEEAIVYSKHTKSLPELDDSDSLNCVNLFNVQYIMNDKKYFVQEYGVQEGNQLLVKTNGYKNGSIKKILSILEPILFNKSIEYPIYEGQVTPAPHTFTGHQLIRLPRFRMPVDEDLPSIIAIDLTVRNHSTHTLHLNSNVPLKEIVALFREVEQKIDPKDTGYTEQSIKVSPNHKVARINIHSLKSFKPITRLPKQIVVKVWNMLVRTGCIDNVV